LLDVSTERTDPGPSLAAPGTSHWLWGGIIFLSAFLLFQVQPILAKLVLPWFGGMAGVWTISLVFYQAAYLFGNLYAHCLIRWGGWRYSARVHAVALLASLALLPILPGASWQPTGEETPEWAILGLLAATVGLPFLLLSATSSLLQAWHTWQHEGSRPYRFYALSNAGSLLALLSYPFVVEPNVATRRQAIIWSVAYGVFVLLCAAMALRRGAKKTIHADVRSTPPSWSDQLLWLGLAAVASALLLSTTHHVSQNIAAVPLLWIVPLALYLLSLILCFEGHRWYRRWLFLRMLPVALGAMAYALSPEFENAGPLLQAPLFWIGLFICCMACHGEMAGIKPRPEHLTLFYLMVSAGGALGGIFVGVIAPRIFRGFYELPLALGLCALLILIVLYREPDSPQKLAQPALLATTGLTALLLVFLFHVTRLHDRRAQVMVRNFYGVLRVNNVAPGAVRPAMRQLLNGTIVHGAQILDAARHSLATTYFGEQSGAGVALLLARQQGALRVGVVGLGVGTLARYGREGDRYVFYEINPLVVDLANTQFDYVRESPAEIEIVPGDARLAMENQAPQNFDVLLVDAFSSDAIPVHLLTREAFELYFRHLKPQGVLAIHVSNRYLDLVPVVEAAARIVGARATTVVNPENQENAVYSSTWMLLDKWPRSAAEPIGAAGGPASPPTKTGASSEERIVPPWTDDYSSLLGLFK
jgi:SAM-dependent methyltransferase